MEYEEVILEGFSVVGISIRTTNKNDQSEKDIRRLRMEFFSKNIADDINNRVSDDLYCVYNDFEDGEEGHYTAIMGYKVYDTNDVTGEYAYADVEAGKYLKFITKGEIPHSARATWEYIWNTNLNRKYMTDFDVFDKNSGIGSDKGQLTTYISVE